jgi:hypothetical protein
LNRGAIVVTKPPELYNILPTTTDFNREEVDTKSILPFDGRMGGFVDAILLPSGIQKNSVTGNTIIGQYKKASKYGLNKTIGMQAIYSQPKRRKETKSQKSVYTEMFGTRSGICAGTTKTKKQTGRNIVQDCWGGSYSAPQKPLQKSKVTKTGRAQKPIGYIGLSSVAQYKKQKPITNIVQDCWGISVKQKPKKTGGKVTYPGLSSEISNKSKLPKLSKMFEPSTGFIGLSPTITKKKKPMSTKPVSVVEEMFGKRTN